MKFLYVRRKYIYIWEFLSIRVWIEAWTYTYETYKWKIGFSSWLLIIYIEWSSNVPYIGWSCNQLYKFVLFVLVIEKEIGSMSPSLKHGVSILKKGRSVGLHIWKVELRL